MRWPYVCEYCGGNLDAGERCDCQTVKNEGRQQDNDEEANTHPISYMPTVWQGVAAQHSGGYTA